MSTIISYNFSIDHWLPILTKKPRPRKQAQIQIRAQRISLGPVRVKTPPGPCKDGHGNLRFIGRDNRYQFRNSDHRHRVIFDRFGTNQIKKN